MHTELRYGTTGMHDSKDGVWIDLCVASVPADQEAAVRRILERARDELAVLLVLSGG
jgi:hypothetical protein